MKQVRLVYRCQLLPPLILPFETIKEYFIFSQPKQAQELRHMNNDGRKALFEAKKSEMQKTNKLLIEQAASFRLKYINPLRNCPCYLDQLYKKMYYYTIGGKEEFYKNINNFSINDKLSCHLNAKIKYQKFKQSKQQQNSALFEQISQIPIFLYKSPSDIAIRKKKVWQQMTDSMKNDCQHQYYQLLQEYNTQLKAYCKKVNLLRSQFFQILSEPLQYVSNSNIRKFLLQQ